jgi:hypothetical protein
VPGRPGTVDGFLQGRVGGRGQVAGRRHRGQRRAGARAGELGRQPPRGVADPDGHRVRFTGRLSYAVNIFLTLEGCQLRLYVG